MGDFSATKDQNRLHVVVNAVEELGHLLTLSMAADRFVDPTLAGQVRELFEHPWEPRSDLDAFPTVYASWKCTVNPGAWAIHLSLRSGMLLISLDMGAIRSWVDPLVQVQLGNLEGAATRLADEAQPALFRVLVATIIASGQCALRVVPGRGEGVALGHVATEVTAASTGFRRGFMVP